MTEPPQRVAIVTGAARGIGRSIAMTLADAGMHVISADVLPDQTYAVDGVEPRLVDVRDPLSCTALVEQVVADHGRLDVLVNNAAINLRKTAVETASAEWDAVLGTNLSGTFTMCRAAHPVLTRSRGCVVNLGSVGGHLGVPGSAAYGVSKAAIMHLTKVLAVEWGADGVRVNAVAPTLVASPMTEDVLRDPDYLAAKLRSIPLGRLPSPYDVAAAVEYLASDRAASITGHTLFVDGGAAII